MKHTSKLKLQPFNGPSYNEFLHYTLTDVSKIARTFFGKVEGVTKPDNTVVTKVDFKIGKQIIDKLQNTFPDANIIDEEKGVIDKQSKLTWVIDPIDGTSNYALGIPLYGIMIGLLENNQPIAGGVALPYFNEIIIAEKNKGAFCNATPIHVTKEKTLRSTLVAYGSDPHYEDPAITRKEFQKLFQIYLGIRNLRSSNCVYDSMLVAKGKYGGFLSRTSKIWDNVAQQVILEESGAVYTDFFGNSINYSNPLRKVNDNFTFCMASPTLHNSLQQLIAKKSDY